MKLLVIQEQHFYRMPDGEVWTKEQSDSKFWERYLNIFEEIIVCARFEKMKEKNTNGLLKSDHENVSFIELPNFRGVKGLIKNFFKTKKIIRNAIDMSDRIIFRAPSPISMVAYPIVRKCGKPFATELMNNPYTHYSPQAMKHIYQPIIRKIIVKQTKSLCKDANGVAYVTENVLQKLYPCQSLKYGTNNKYFDSSYSTIRLDEEDYFYDKNSIDNNTDIIKFIHTGKMEDNRKGQDIVIQTIALLKDKGYNVKCTLVGDGEKRHEFEQLSKSLNVGNCINFVGWKAGFDELKTELRKSQIGIFPSIGEGLPRSIIEAMSQGVLCFGSEIDGIVELLDEKFLIKKLEPQFFAEKISYFLDNLDKIEVERKKQFEKSKEYEYKKLEKKRNVFYKKLKEVNVNE